jgi:hypothetical protein
MLGIVPHLLGIAPQRESDGCSGSSFHSKEYESLQGAFITRLLRADKLTDLLCEELSRCVNLSFIEVIVSHSI